MMSPQVINKESPEMTGSLYGDLPINIDLPEISVTKYFGFLREQLEFALHDIKFLSDNGYFPGVKIIDEKRNRDVWVDLYPGWGNWFISFKSRDSQLNFYFSRDTRIEEIAVFIDMLFFARIDVFVRREGEWS